MKVFKYQYVEIQKDTDLKLFEKIKDAFKTIGYDVSALKLSEINLPNYKNIIREDCFGELSIVHYYSETDKTCFRRMWLNELFELAKKIKIENKLKVA